MHSPRQCTQSDRTLGQRGTLGLSFFQGLRGKKVSSICSGWGCAFCEGHLILHVTNPKRCLQATLSPQLCDSKVILWFQTVVEMTSMSDPFLPLQQKPGMVPPPPGEESQTVILPPGWHSYLSPQGRRYYVNTTTNGESRSGSGRAFSNPPPPTRLPLPGLLFSLPFHPLVWGFFLLNLTQGKVTWHLNPLVLELFIVCQGL